MPILWTHACPNAALATYAFRAACVSSYLLYGIKGDPTSLAQEGEKDVFVKVVYGIFRQKSEFVIASVTLVPFFNEPFHVFLSEMLRPFPSAIEAITVRTVPLLDVLFFVPVRLSLFVRVLVKINQGYGERIFTWNPIWFFSMLQPNMC